jgi:DNA-binding transcriptional regulator PaaX
MLRKLLLRKQGATVAQIQKQLGWQPHTVRAAISRLRSSGFSIELDRSGKVTRYRVLSGGGQ